MNVSKQGRLAGLARLCSGFLAAVMVMSLAAWIPVLTQHAAAAPTTVSAANTILSWEATSPQGATVTLDGTASSADTVTYEWWETCTAMPCPEGVKLTEASASPSSQVQLGIGNHAITLWGGDAGGSLAPSPLIVVEVVATAPVANAGPDTSVAATSPGGAAVSLNGTGSTGAASYSWSTTAAGEIATGPTPIVILPIGTTKVTLTVGSAAGVFATDDVNITVNPTLPDANAGPDQTVPSTDGNPVAVTLDGSGSINTSSYAWDLPGNLPNATGVAPVVNLPVGNHSITLTATSPSGNTDTDTVAIAVTGPPPPLNADAGPDRTAYMTNGTTALVPMDGTNSTGAVSYSWRVVGSVAAPFTGPRPTFLLTQGVHTIRLTITGSDGSTDTDDAVITVLPEPALSADAGPDQTVVATNGTTAQVQLDGSGSGGAVSYAWNLPGALPDATGQKPVVNLPIGSFSITLTTTSASGATRIDTVVITVQKPPPSSTVSENQGPTGTVLNYSFIGFPSNTVVNIFFVGGGASVQATQINSNASGVGGGSLVVPTMIGGAKEVRFVVAGSIVSLSGFTITPRFKLTPAVVEPGGAVTMSVTGFRANEDIRIRWRINGEFLQVASGSTNASGTASGTISVPAGANLGVNTVRVDGTVSSAQTSGISVVASAEPAAIISPDRGIVGTGVTYNITNFPSQVTVNIALIRPSGGSVILGTVETNGDGAATGSFTIPATPGGADQTIRFTSGGASADASFEVVPRIRVSPGTQGGQTGVSLRGFGKDETVNIRWLVGGTYRTVATVTTSNSGSANFDVTIPSNAAIGNNTVRAEGQLFNAQTNVAEVAEGIPPAPEPVVTVSPDRAIVNTTISYTIEHFPASATVDITFQKSSGTPLFLGSVQTDANGAASGSFDLPATPGGAGQAVRFTSGLVIEEAAFEVAPRIKVDDGTAGQPVGVSLRGFGKDEVVQIRWLVGDTWVPVGTATMSNSGSANTTVTIPLTAAGGNNSVRADGPQFAAQTNFASVIAADLPAATVSPNRAIVGTAIAFSLQNFPASSTVSVSLWKGSGTPLALGTVETDASGLASGGFELPATTGGAGQAIRFTSGDVSVDAPFEVAPRILAGGGVAGGPSSISLRGFAANSEVLIRWRVDGVWEPVGTVTTSNTGSANTTVTIPADAAVGNNSVRADGGSFAAQTNFAPVTTTPPAEAATASVSPDRAIVGTTIAYSLANFPADATVAISLQKLSGSPIELGTVQTDAGGDASGNFDLPATPGGPGQAIRFTSGSVSVDADFEIAPRILVSDGAAGGETGVSLRGFAADEQVVIRWRVDGLWVEVGEATMSNTGSANTTVTIPEDAAIGNNSVRADGPFFAAQTNFAQVSAADTVPTEPVEGASATVSPTRAIVNTSIAYSVENFPADAPVSVTLQKSSGSPVDLGTVQTDASGAASGNFDLPATTGGPGQAIRFVAGATTVDVGFEVAPRIKVGDGVAGFDASVSLRGFAANSEVLIRWRVDGAWVPVGTVTTSNTGSANTTVTIPADAAVGNNSVRADGDSFAAQTNFAVVSAPIEPE